MFLYNSKNKKNAQELRVNMTAEEKRLWYDLLKKLPITVKRQFRIGDYIVDFYVPRKKVVIEVDGRQHLMIENKHKDEIRDKKLAACGITVIRIPNDYINNNFNNVANCLIKKLGIDCSEIK